jgi:hypothetical protein
MSRPDLRFALLAAIAVGSAFAALSVASADHAWSNYHWARTSNPFTLQVVNSMTSDWNATLTDVRADWNQSTIVQTSTVAGDTSQKARKTCKPVAGKIRSCNAAYGYNGWIGLARIWLNSDGHIVQAVTKMNESYFALSAYNDSGKRHGVLCMEIGHTFGLGHNDNGPTGGILDDTCMNDQEWFEHPNSHDFDQLATIYAHTDSANTYSTSASSGGGPGNSNHDDVDVGPPAGTGPRDGDTFIQRLADGTTLITHVVWAGQ